MRLHSYLSKKCRLNANSKGEKGIFAIKEIHKDELIAIWGGNVYSKYEIKKLSKKYSHYQTHPVSVYDGYYLGSTRHNMLDDVEYINHSCEPNAGVKGQIILVARRKIVKGEEVCFDYDTTEISATPFKCHCGSIKCRKIIDGSAWKSLEFQKENWQFFSWYIMEKIINRKGKRNI